MDNYYGDNVMARKIKVQEVLKHEVKRKLVKEMARTQEWFPKRMKIKLGPSRGSKEIAVEAMFNEKRYPGLAYADLGDDNKFIVFHIPSGKPLFYNVNNEAQARKIVRLINEGIKKHGVSWSEDESSIMSKDKLKFYADVVKRTKKQVSKRNPQKHD